MKKLLIFVIFFTLAFTVNAKEITVNSKATYEFNVSGNTHVTHEISIDNGSSGKYASDFRLNLHDLDPKNVSASENSIPLQVSVVSEDEKKSILVNFVKMNLGDGNIKEFKIEYDLPSASRKTGDIWDISVPGLRNEDLFDNYEINLIIPTSFGEEAFINPQPLTYSYTDEYQKYTYAGDQVLNSQISGAFGDFQSYEFKITYHLENPLNQDITTQIAIPPDTDYQRSSILSIDPKPENIYVDPDGNWIADYKLSKRERLDVIANVVVDVFPISRNFFKPSENYLSRILSSNDIWDYESIPFTSDNVDNPKMIYDFVVSSLDYDYARMGSQTKRLSASSIIGNPNTAICTDYSDLTISLLRKSGVPAREIQGYAYSKNDDTEPISLVEDVLHSWVEYWDDNTNRWIQIDPTWADTSGDDYFESFDLRHVAFVIHGTDPQKPLPPGSYNYGPDPIKDVEVSVLGINNQGKTSSTIQAHLSHKLPIIPSKLFIDVSNDGSKAIYGSTLEIFFDEVLHQEIYINTLLPFDTQTYSIDVPYSLSGSDIPQNVIVRFEGNSFTTSTQKQLHTYLNILIIGLFLLTILGYLIYKAKHLRS